MQKCRTNARALLQENSQQIIASKKKKSMIGFSIMNTFFSSSMDSHAEKGTIRRRHPCKRSNATLFTKEKHQIYTGRNEKKRGEKRDL